MAFRDLREFIDVMQAGGGPAAHRGSPLGSRDRLYYRVGIAEVQGVWGHCHTLLIVISLRQKYPGHAMQALTATAGLQVGASMYRYVVAVDDDIDPSDLNQVLWAMTTRVDPSESVQVLRSWTSDLDPRVPPEKRANGDYTSGRMLIDACRPFTWREQFASPNRFSEPMRKRIWQKWLADLEKTRSAGGA
jgi:3-polyprenyl-4-hydroxybenzoate decarboxylase